MGFMVILTWRSTTRCIKEQQADRKTGLPFISLAAASCSSLDGKSEVQFVESPVKHEATAERFHNCQEFN